MDPFVEKDIVDCLKSIALSLRNMDRKMDDIALSLREFVSAEEDEIETELATDEAKE